PAGVHAVLRRGRGRAAGGHHLRDRWRPVLPDRAVRRRRGERTVGSRRADRRPRGGRRFHRHRAAATGCWGRSRGASAGWPPSWSPRVPPRSAPSPASGTPGPPSTATPRSNSPLRIEPQDGSSSFEGRKTIVASRVDLPYEGKRYPVWYARDDRTSFLLATKVGPNDPPEVRRMF